MQLELIDGASATDEMEMSNQDYLRDLFDEGLGSKGLHEHRFPFLLGDDGQPLRNAVLAMNSLLGTIVGWAIVVLLIPFIWLWLKIWEWTETPHHKRKLP